ncbi:hypothetical protein GR158_17020 [Shinella sp. AETb1-6]|uniref:hypothetical protein n=1 Tax=Shinella sp. AETb1-6 TaxID=2692210 RepID=UPI001370637A|nr:hypothetical protein [Shinella sp. AETb1-6]MXN52816.1 hypothetical protein [Shinella sp. AETb1-6]
MSRAYVNPLARRQPAVVASARAIKAWTREFLALGDDIVVSVNELSCALPDCPPKETVILVMFPGQPPIQASIHKVMPDVTHDDIAAAFEQGVLIRSTPGL